MYLLGVTISNIRAIQQLSWRLTDIKQAPGWHVIVGDNGSGKSSFLRAIGLALVGPRDATALRQPWSQWLGHGQQVGRIRLNFIRDHRFDKISGKGRVRESSQFTAGLLFRKDDDVEPITLDGYGAERTIWGKGEGWFSASYGPFRRFRGGDPEYKKVFYSIPRLGRHLSLFDESVALSECLEWLQSLRFKQLEKDPEGKFLAPIRHFINQDGFLPFGAKLQDITSSSVRFVDGNSAVVDVENLSDGYRSILSLTFELIRQMATVYGADAVFDQSDPTTVAAPGVVLIDEIDAHLHPTWQRRVGVWFRKHFPNVQFIVTTHSPIVCQAADHGTVYRLPSPGTEEKGRFVKGIELKRLLYGSILDAYSTEIFGDGITRSAIARAYLDELAQLNIKEMDDGLSPEDKKRQAELRSILPAEAFSTPEVS